MQHIVVKMDRNGVWHYWLEQDDYIVQFELTPDEFREKRMAEAALLAGKPCDIRWVLLLADGDFHYIVPNGGTLKDFRADQKTFNLLRLAENRCLVGESEPLQSPAFLSAIL